MTKPEKIAWIERMAPMAIASAKKWGVPASVTLAQAYVESADSMGNPGESGVAKRCNNFFGVKVRQGEQYVEFQTKEYEAGRAVLQPGRFRKYDSIAESFDAHGKLLATLDRYRMAMSVADDPLAFCLQLQLSKYSTRPDYADYVAGFIKSYNLTRFDKQAKETA